MNEELYHKMMGHLADAQYHLPNAEMTQKFHEVILSAVPDTAVVKSSDDIYEELIEKSLSLGLVVSTSAQDALRRAAYEMHADHGKPRGRFGSTDVNDRWQTYSAEGNATMQFVFESLAAMLREGTITRLTLSEHIRKGFAAMESMCPGQGYQDTEPRNELLDALDSVLDELGYKPLEEGW